MRSTMLLLLKKGFSSALLLLLTAQAFATTNNYSIGISFATDQLLEDLATPSAIAATDLAGIPVPATGLPTGRQFNWNNVELPTGNLANLVADNRDAAVVTAASVEWFANGTWSTSGSRGAAENNGTNFMVNTPDHVLMTGYLDVTGAGTPSRVTLRDLPAELTATGYHVYVYSQGGARAAGRGGSIRVVDADTGTPLTPFLHITTIIGPTTYVRDLGVNHTDTGNYLVFTNLASPNIIVEGNIAVLPGTGTPRAPINAVQLVAAGLTEPIVGQASGNAQFFYLTMTDLAAAVVDTTSIEIILDGQTPKVPLTINKQGGLTSITYDHIASQNALFAAGSTHNLDITFKDTAGKTYTAQRSFSVGNYTTVPAEYAAKGVDKTKPGFRVRVHQLPFHLRQPGDANWISNGERQLSNGFIDPATGQPHLNQADLTFATDGWFIDENIINWNQDAPAAIGNFSTATTPAFEDEPIPGIPGFSLTATDGIAAEIVGYLELSAGAYRFGVNSDDGFRFSTSYEQGDIAGLTLGSFNAGRGAADTTFDFAVSQSGIYPVRLTWWEGTGGANVELFMVDLLTGAKTPVNEASAAVKSYRDSSSTRPWVSRLLPAANDPLVTANADILVELTDGTIPVDAGSVSLTLNGTALTDINKSGKVTTIKRAGSLADLLPAGNNSLSLKYSFTENGTTVNVTRDWTFIVVSYTALPVGNKIPASQINTADTGFNARVHQIDRSGDANQGNGDRFPGDSNRMPRPEVQLLDGYINLATGEPFPNLALPGPNADGSYDFDFLNFNAVSGNSGIFQGTAATLPPTDQPTPGMPGGGSSNTGRDNYVMESVAYLELKAGLYLFGVNSDDGFLVTSAPNPKDTLGTVLGFFNGGRGNAGSLPAFNPASVIGNSAFSVIVPEDGIYPFRVLFWQGGGGVNVEFFHSRAGDGQQALVGNTTDFAFGIPAYRTYTGPARPWVKFSVSPTPWDNLIQQTGPGPLIFKGRTPSSVDAVDTYNRPDLVNNVNTNRPFADTAIGAIIANLGSGAVEMLLNGAPVSPSVTPSGSDMIVSYKPPTPLPPGSVNTATLIYGGVANSWSWTVQGYNEIPESVALPLTAAQASDRGFRARVMKIRNGTAGVGGNLQRAEDHLRGALTFPNTAVPGPEPDGSYILTGIVNWNEEMRGGNSVQVGNFRTDSGGFRDDPIPGVGLGTTGEAANADDLISGEVVAYLDLPAGYIKMGVNSDDGFRVSVATGYDPGALVLSQFDAGKGSSDIPFSFVVKKAGLYPIRLLWFEQTGGANLEFFSYGPNGEKIPVNDPNNPAAIKAYFKVKPSEPPTLTITRLADGKLRIEFEGTLQRTDSLSPLNWQDVTGVTSPVELTPTSNERYWRAVR